MSIQIGTLGFPRIGPRRELMTSLDDYRAGKADAAALQENARGLRAAAWIRQWGLGITHVPSNDFSFHDHVLDTSVMLGAVPPAHDWNGSKEPLDLHVAMARGTRRAATPSCRGGGHGNGLPAPETARWFDTSYHHVVPGFTRTQSFSLASTKPVDEFLEAKALGIHTRPVLLGPVTWLTLGRSRDADFDPLSLLPGLLPVYAALLIRLAAAGADWVQIDEPCLVLDLDGRTRAALRTAYDVLAAAAPGVRLLLTTYFGGLGDNLDMALALPVAGLHLDLVRAPGQLAAVLERRPPRLALSLGVVDGRNVWRADLEALLDRLEPALDRLGAERLMLGPSCSLLHVPVDLDLETDLDPDLRRWMAFAVQKADELAILGRALDQGRSAVRAGLDASTAARASRRASRRVNDPVVQARLAGLDAAMSRRSSPFPDRRAAQRERLGLPAFPTTIIGSLPQTAAVRNARADHRKGALSAADRSALLRRETEAAVRRQEEVGLDVLVHGAFERNGMVRYFGERLAGFAVTRHGWVQCCGSRCVRPPVIFGDVSRPAPMTVGWSVYAQSLTERPMKGMLTGPVTLLHWSFARDDMPRMEVCRQIALAIRDEVTDLERAGIPVIQIDEPALREGLPLRRAERQGYLAAAVHCFRLASCGVSDRTQIHAHMRCPEFNDIIEAIGALDADVISIETTRPTMELLDAFPDHHYPNGIGPGVCHIDAVHCPTVEEMVGLLRRAKGRLSADRIWVNPDGGLTTRSWDEIRPALANMVAAAAEMRRRVRRRPPPGLIATR